MVDKQKLKEQLTTGIVAVEFEKSDGTLRKMSATLQESFLPTPVASDDEINRNRAPNEEIQVVWDTESNGWRSFRFDRLKSVAGVAV
jgi:predicted DNA-binding transcriptional regulator YafY